jgi:hypothetical protein
MCNPWDQSSASKRPRHTQGVAKRFNRLKMAPQKLTHCCHCLIPLYGRISENWPVFRRREGGISQIRFISQLVDEIGTEIPAAVSSSNRYGTGPSTETAVEVSGQSIRAWGEP